MKIAISKNEIKMYSGFLHRLFTAVEEKLHIKTPVVYNILNDEELDELIQFLTEDVNEFGIMCKIVDDNILVIEYPEEFLSDSTSIIEGILIDMIDFVSNNKFKLFGAAFKIIKAFDKFERKVKEAVSDLIGPASNHLKKSISRHYDPIVKKYMEKYEMEEKESDIV